MSKRMRPFGHTIPLDEARARIEDAIRPITRLENVTLDAAAGRVLADDIVAPADVPPFSRAAMDGYAVRAVDTTGASRTAPCVLRSLGRAYTGEVSTTVVEAGTCLEIATGAPMPEGADAVVMVEETASDDDGEVRVLSPVQPRQHVGRQGADIERGHTVLHVGQVLTPSRLGALAAIGLADVPVYARPRVAIVSTGNEIVPPGQALRPGQIHDVNRFTLSAIVAAHGGVPVTSDAVPDTLDALSAAVDRCRGEADVLVFSGGSSVGERDLLLDVLRARGEVIFHGIAVKPGKPTAFGLVDGKPFFGLPGYPTSCLSNGYILLAPALRQLARLPAATPRSVRVPTGQRIVSLPGRYQFYTVRLVDGVALPAFKASGDITSMSNADGYIEIPTDVEVVEQGELVDVRLF